MVLDNNKTMLVYGFEEEDLAFIENIIKELNLPSYKIIEKNMANMRVKDIIDGPVLGTYDKQLVDEKVVLFNNFTDNELNIAIKTIRSNKSIKPILAVVTATSTNWEFHYLLEHLLEEREQAKKLMQQNSLNK
jgi:hypothetical protein